MPASTYPIANLWVGLGCRQGTPLPMFEQALRTVCLQYAIDWAMIAGLATLDAKRAEPGLLGFSLAQDWPLIYFTQGDLKRCAVPHPSVMVNTAVGVPSVCEAAALSAAAQAGSAMWSTLIVPKQVFWEPQTFGAVTVAIAQRHILNLR
jgi:cobalt-precorrin 5A hydrolase / precorrin-3B C17-methyltransferase